MTISSHGKTFKVSENKENFAYLIFGHAFISSTFGAITHFDIGEIFYRHFSVHSSPVEESLSFGWARKDIRRGKKCWGKLSTSALCLLSASLPFLVWEIVKIFKYLMKISMVFSAKLCIIKMINIYLPISYIIQASPFYPIIFTVLRKNQRRVYWK